MTLPNQDGVVQPTGKYGSNWPSFPNLPQGKHGKLSTGGWTLDNAQENNFGNEGFVQQTFLGASIIDVNLSAGFGDTASTLSCQLVNDEYNGSDGFGLGAGDDPYHNGVQDTFLPPVVGTPVYFKFGKNLATIDQAFRQTYDDIYGIQTLPARDPESTNSWGYTFPSETWEDDEDFTDLPLYSYVDRIAGTVEDRSALWDINSVWRGRNHLSFGGILQSYTQNKSDQGRPLYNVQLTDPREILSNVPVLLNNYQGTTFNNKNLINLYGFLEYDPSVELVESLNSQARSIGIIEKVVANNGTVSYIGVETEWDSKTGWEVPKNPVPANVAYQGPTWSKDSFESYTPPSTTVNLTDLWYFGPGLNLPAFFPITGQGFSRRSEKGMPWYRISQGLAAMFQYYGYLPEEYVNAGFGGQINFRGYNYVVDFSGMPVDKIPNFYYFDFDQIDLLSLAQEICDITSHELYVQLLPVIDHPASAFLYSYNQRQLSLGAPENMVAGIIRLDGIDKSVQPKYGAIKSYLDTLAERGIDVQNQDVGYELSNVTTDKFVAGAQEVDMYFFSTERDRDDLWEDNRENSSENQEILMQTQWDLRTQLQQQVLPYYGMLGETAVTIPRGFGSFQQIMLDSRSLYANGVGDYYVTTELELRAALAGYDSWKHFLLSYNDVYIEDISEHRAVIGAFAVETDQISRVLDKFKADLSVDSVDDISIDEYLASIQNKSYAVTVPRCVFHTNNESFTPITVDGEVVDAYPTSPCSPPFGYPLYYRRATRVGIVEAGIGKVIDAKVRIAQNKQAMQEQYNNQNNPQALYANKDQIRIRIEQLEEQKTKFFDTYGPESDQYRATIEAIAKLVTSYANWETIRSNAEQNKNLIAEIEEYEKEGSFAARELFNIEKTARMHDENARKVHEFLRKIADECLGKKFLVRLPKSCNKNFTQDIIMFDGQSPQNIKSGPFGFPPRPISPAYEDAIIKVGSEGGYDANDLVFPYLKDYKSPAAPQESEKISYLSRYNSGALKGNYNPIAEKWEWNYQPTNQGGFFSFDAYPISVLNAPSPIFPYEYNEIPVIKNGLAPADIVKVSEAGRMSCYVKYNNSQELDFGAIGADQMSQQTVGLFGGGIIPDVARNLPNTNPNKKISFDENPSKNPNARIPEPAVAFVKCEVEEKLYMPPKLKQYNLEVHGNEYTFKLTIPKPTTTETYDPETCETVVETGYRSPVPVFGLPIDGGVDGTSVPWVDFERFEKLGATDNNKANLVETSTRFLDDEHVYALITVPGRIKSTAERRWKDAQQQQYNTVAIKHLLTQDVVCIPEFAKPNIPVQEQESTYLPLCDPPLFPDYYTALAIAGNYGLTGATKCPSGIAGYDGTGGVKYLPGKVEDWARISLEDISSARSISKKALTAAALEGPVTTLGYTSPSPIFPDMVALPLMSMERCYGPWLSASQLDQTADRRIKYSNIGGKVEFVKDENLAPWNYDGYSLMNEAGSLQANFSNSLLLFSERGGFAIPDAPTGIAIAKALKLEGPLITSIGVSVSTGGVSTTVKLDLYTSQFGKLQKQKEMAISQVARERQKITDERNNLIRRGLGKNATSKDLASSVMGYIGNQVIATAKDSAAQVQSNNELSKEIEEFVMVAGKQGSKLMLVSDLKRLAGYLDPNAIADMPLVQGFSSFFKSTEGTAPFRNETSIQNRIDGRNQQP